MKKKTTVSYNPKFEGKDFVCYLHPKYREIGKRSTPSLIISIVRLLETNKHNSFDEIKATIDRQKQYKRFSRTILNVVSNKSRIELFGSRDGVFPIVRFEKRN